MKEKQRNTMKPKRLVFARFRYLCVEVLWRKERYKPGIVFNKAWGWTITISRFCVFVYRLAKHTHTLQRRENGSVLADYVPAIRQPEWRLEFGKHIRRMRDRKPLLVQGT